MIKKQHRLRKNKHFQFVYHRGQTKQTRLISVTYVRTFVQPFKVGFSVSKKVGKSVVRSRVKRLMTEAFNVLEGQVNSGYNYVFSAKPEIRGEAFSEVLKEMALSLKKAGLLNEKK